MNTLSHVLTAIAMLASAVIYGTDVFAAVVLHPALAHVDDEALTSTMGYVHDYGDRRLPAPGALGLVAATLGTVAVALAGHAAVTAANATAVGALVVWLILYGRVSAPVNRQLTTAAHDGYTLPNVRALQRRWDGVINARAILQMLALAALCAGLSLS